MSTTTHPFEFLPETLFGRPGTGRVLVFPASRAARARRLLALVDAFGEDVACPFCTDPDGELPRLFAGCTACLDGRAVVASLLRDRGALAQLPAATVGDMCIAALMEAGEDGKAALGLDWEALPFGQARYEGVGAAVKAVLL